MVVIATVTKTGAELQKLFSSSIQVSRDGEKMGKGGKIDVNNF